MSGSRHITDVDKIDLAITRRGWTWSELAEQADVCKTTLSKVKCGKRPRLGYDAALRVRRVLPEVSLSDLGHPELQARIAQVAGELAAAPA